MNNDKLLIRVREIEARYGIPKATFRRHEVQASLEPTSQFPARIEIGRNVYYRLEDFERWLASNELRGRKP